MIKVEFVTTILFFSTRNLSRFYFLGQVIPPGLHVRMDLTNGGRWAKLMDDNESNHNALVNVVSKNEDISEQKESTER